MKNSEDVKHWAVYKTGIKEFIPWIESAEHTSKVGLTKPENLCEAELLFEEIKAFNNKCVSHLLLLDCAHGAAQQITSHKEADNEVTILKSRYDVVNTIGKERMGHKS